MNGASVFGRYESMGPLYLDATNQWGLCSCSMARRPHQPHHTSEQNSIRVPIASHDMAAICYCFERHDATTAKRVNDEFSGSAIAQYKRARHGGFHSADVWRDLMEGPICAGCRRRGPYPTCEASWLLEHYHSNRNCLRGRTSLAAESHGSWRSSMGAVCQICAPPRAKTVGVGRANQGLSDNSVERWGATRACAGGVRHPIPDRATRLSAS
jgi:hypothetical protein